MSGAVLSLAASPARGQQVARPDTTQPAHLAVSQFHHDRWTTAEGLPNHAIDWMARSPDGYLWLGTEGGLVRFDGVRFTAFDRSNTRALQGSNYPTVPLVVDRQGVLWISTTRGLVLYKDGEFTSAAPVLPDAPTVAYMVEDRAGRLWTWGQPVSGRLYEVRDGRLVPPDSQSGLPERVAAVAADPGGGMWVATLDGRLLRVRDGQSVNALPRDTLPGGVTYLHVAHDGVLWIGAQRGFGRLQDGRFEFYQLSVRGLTGVVSTLAEDAAGDVWVGTVGMGVLRWHAGNLERFDTSDGLLRDQVTSLLVDNEGSVWVGTRGGLNRLRRGAVATFTPRNGGPPFPKPGALLLDRSGRFVVAGRTTGLVAGRPGSWAPFPGAVAAASQKVWTLAHGRDGIWVGADDKLTLYRAGAAPRIYTARDGLEGNWMFAVAEDSLDRLWVGTNEGLFRLAPGSGAFTKLNGLPNDYVHALVVDRRGAVWAGTNGGVARIAGDSVQSWGQADGLAGAVVFTIREVNDGSIWIGTSGGLTRVREGRLAAIRAEQGLPDEMVNAVEEVGDDLWLVTGNGISRVPLADLNAVADGRAPRINAVTFGTRDGLLATEVVAAQPLSARTPDGRLWFSTGGGLVVVDPVHMPRNPIPPAVHVEAVSADGVRLTPSFQSAPSLKVPARTRRLTLSYTATSLLIPDRVRFRYRLIGYDPAWVDAPSTERTVSYTNLGPGRYTFRVIAANDAGVWNEDGATLELTVRPAFYQTAWFGALWIAAVVAGAVALHRARVRQLERRAEERRSKLRQVIDAIPTIAWCNLPDGPNEFLNKGWHEYTGLSPEQSQGWGWQTAFHPDDLPSLTDKWLRMLTSGESDEIEARLRRHDGVYRWFLIRAEPFRDESGEIVRWYGTTTDIDDRKRAEEALQSSERNLRQVIDTIPTLIHVLGPDGSVLYVNPRVLDYTGLTLEDVQRGDYRARVGHPEDAEESLRERRAQALSSAVPFESEYRVLGKDGQYRWFLSGYNPLLDDQGKIDRWYVTATDIDGRKRAEEELKHAYLHLTEAQRLSRTGSAITDVQADDRKWSEELFRIFEFDPATKVTRQMIRDRVHPDDLPSFDAEVARGMTGESSTIVFRIVIPPGTVKHLRTTSHRIDPTPGHPLFIGAFQEITESKVAEEALTRARAELAHMARVTTLSALTASIAHEINQPIAAAITSAGACLRWLDRDEPEVQRAREAAMRIEEDGKRAAEIVTRVKSLYRKDVSPEREMVSVNDVVNEMLRLLRSEADRHSVVMRTALAADLPSVSADRVQLQQVLLNLMLNGMEAMSARGGELEISSRCEDREVMVSVSDTGVGIPGDKMEEIFTEFFTTKAEGTGMGLAISSTIIESHGGRLWPTANPGPGATFHFTLPTEPET